MEFCPLWRFSDLQGVKATLEKATYERHYGAMTRIGKNSATITRQTPSPEIARFIAIQN